MVGPRVGCRAWPLFTAMAMAACGDNVGVRPDALAADAPIDAPCLGSALHTLTLDHGAFPPAADYPSVVVYVPAGFDPTPPIDIVVFLHGNYNCATNVVGATDAPCSAGGATRPAFALASQLDVSARNALLVVPELAFDAGSSNPGALATANGFRDLLAETLGKLPSPLGPAELTQVGKVLVIGHGGGYAAAAAIAADGAVTSRELWLLDALYGQTATFDAWVNADLASFATRDRRFVDMYAIGGGTLANSQAMANRAATWVPADELVDDRTTAPVTDAVYQHGLVFKLSDQSHDAIARTYVAPLLSTSQLRTRSCP